jgi:LPXTG-motif cell wall-anchored protein
MVVALMSAVIGCGCVFTVAESAWGAAPQGINHDYAATGSLEGAYTRAELTAAPADPVVAEYAAQEILREQRGTTVSRGGRAVLPSTGSQIALMVGVGVLLVVIGLLLRRAARRQSSTSDPEAKE